MKLLRLLPEPARPSRSYLAGPASAAQRLRQVAQKPFQSKGYFTAKWLSSQVAASHKSHKHQLFMAIQEVSLTLYFGSPEPFPR